MKQIVLTITTLLFCITVYAQPGSGGGASITLTGKVVDEGSGQPLEYATVSLYSTADSSLLSGGVTDAKGSFSLQLKERNIYMEVSFIGYQTKRITGIEIGSDKIRKDMGTIGVAPDAKALNTVDVVAEKSTMKLELDKRVFTVGKDLSNTGNNASDVLDNIPSVSVDVEGGVSLRGSGNVRILINGKPSGLVGNSGEALQMLQSDQIERIEVITNPSAKYEAQGEVGIINIILKKDKKAGLNGSVSATTGWPHRHTVGANLNYRTGNVNLFGGLSGGYKRFQGRGETYQENYFGDSTAIYSTDREHSRGGWNLMGRLGADIYIKETNILTFSGTVSESDNSNDVDILYSDYDNNDNLVSQSQRIEDEQEDDLIIEAEGIYKRTFDKEKQEFSASFKYMFAEDHEKSSISEEEVTGGSALTNQRLSNTEDEQNYIFQADYIHPFAGTGKWEVGVRSGNRFIQNDYSVEEQDDSGDWELIEGFFDDFKYYENIYAGYSIIGMKHGGFSWQAGLRAEYSDITTDSEVNGEVNKRYLDWFPSAHLSYEITKTHTLQLSYSRRISRPRFRELLPFSGFSDARNVYGGNPDLNPEYTHSIEVGYLADWEGGSLLSSVYYRYRTGVVERVNVLNDDGITLRIPVNISTENAVGVEFTVDQDLFKWWSVNGGINLYYSKSQGNYEGLDLGAETFAANMRFNSKWKLPLDFDIQASVMWRSPRNRAQGRSLSMTGFDIAIAKDVIKGNGTLTFSVRDVFNTRKYRSEIDTDEFYQRSEFQWRVRQFLLTFNYRINQKNRGGKGMGDMNDF